MTDNKALIYAHLPGPLFAALREYAALPADAAWHDAKSGPLPAGARALLRVWDDAPLPAGDVPVVVLGQGEFAFPLRLQAALQAVETAFLRTQNTLAMGVNVTLNVATRTLFGPGGEVFLPQKEAELLEFLAKNIGKVIEKETVEAGVWGHHPDTASHTLETHLYRLRQKFKQLSINDVEISTQNGGVGLTFLPSP